MVISSNIHNIRYVVFLSFCWKIAKKCYTAEGCLHVQHRHKRKAVYLCDKHKHKVIYAGTALCECCVNSLLILVYAYDISIASWASISTRNPCVDLG